MAFYLKLPERDNTQGCPARQTPSPRVAPLRLLRCLAPALCPNNSELCQLCPLYCHFIPLQCCKSHIMPLTRAETCLECVVSR